MVLIEYDNDATATYTVNALASRVARQMKVIGVDGMIECEFEGDEHVTFTQRYTGRTERWDPVENLDIHSHGGADEHIFGDFFRICREGGTPRSTVHDGRLAVQLSLAATKSDDTGSVVTF